MLISTTFALVILFNVQLAQAVLNDTRCGSYYYVTGFETLESITNNNTAMIDQIVYFNNLTTRNASLTPNTGLCIPATIVNALNICPSNAVPYTLKKGETTTSIFSTQPPLDNWVVGTLFGANKWMSPRMYGEGYLVCVPKANFTMFNLTNTRCVYYTVQAGETLTSIAAGNVDLINEMIIMNGFPTSTPALAANSTICLPYSRPNSMVTPPCNANYYVPRTNDTVQSLSSNNATLIDALLTANNWTAPAPALVPGLPICFPNIFKPARLSFRDYNLSSTLEPFNFSVPNGCRPGSIPYTVKYGESPYSISNNNATLVSGLMSSNPWMSPTYLTEGNTICIPEALYFEYTLFSTKDISGCQYYHTKKGDSFATLQSAPRLTLIDKANPVYPFNSSAELPVGSILCIPTNYLQKKYPFNLSSPFPDFVPAHANCTYYHVKQGDTIASLTNNNMPALVNGLVAENLIGATDALPLGKILCLPTALAAQYNTTSAPTPASGCSSSIATGMDYARIANGNGTMIAMLLAANPKTNFYYGGSYGSLVCLPK